MNNAQIDKIEVTNECWLSVEEVSNLLGKTLRWIQKLCKNGEITYKVVKKDGVDTYSIQLSSLPPYAQIKYHESRGNITSDKSVSLVEKEAAIYKALSEYERRQVDRWLPLLKASWELKGSALSTFINEWNAKYPGKPFSVPSLYRMRKLYTRHGVYGIAGKWGHDKGATTIPEKIRRDFCQLYLNQNKLTLAKIYTILLGKTIQENTSLAETFPSMMAFHRYRKTHIPPAVECYHREGEEVFNRKFGYFIERDWTAVAAGEVWYSDHHQLDVCVSWKGKQVFPWVTAWMDAKTNKVLVAFLHAEAPNSDHVFYSFALGVEQYGFPKMVYLDNGRDYQCRDFAQPNGTRRHRVEIEKSNAMTLMGIFAIAVIWAIPGNAQAKTIERKFKDWTESLSKFYTGYRGSNTQQRPEKLAEEMKNEKLVSYDEFEVQFTNFVFNISNKTPSFGKLKGMCPDEAWALEFKVKEVPSRDTMAMCLMRTSRAVTIGRGGAIYDSELDVTYWADWTVLKMGTSVYLRRHLKDYSTAYAVDAETHAFIDVVTLKGKADAIAEAPQSRETLHEENRKKRSVVKTVRTFVAQVQDLGMGPKEMEDYVLSAVTYQNKKRGYNNEDATPVEVIKTTEFDIMAQKARENAKRGKQALPGHIPQKKQKADIYAFKSDRPQTDAVDPQSQQEAI